MAHLSRGRRCASRSASFPDIALQDAALVSVRVGIRARCKVSGGPTELKPAVSLVRPAQQVGRGFAFLERSSPSPSEIEVSAPAVILFTVFPFGCLHPARLIRFGRISHRSEPTLTTRLNLRNADSRSTESVAGFGNRRDCRVCRDADLRSEWPLVLRRRRRAYEGGLLMTCS